MRSFALLRQAVTTSWMRKTWNCWSPKTARDDAGPRVTRGHNTKISSLDVDQPKILKDKLEGRHHGNGGSTSRRLSPA